MGYKICWVIANILFKIFFRIQIKGREKIPSKEGFVLAANHLSNLDPLVLGVGCVRKLHFLAKEELFNNKIFASLIKYFGAIPLKRNRADTLALRSAIEILNNQGAVAIFPQGRRSHILEKERVKRGVGFLFKKTNCKIIAGRIYGTDKVLPKGKRLIRPHKIKIIFEEVKNIEKEKEDAFIAQQVLETIKNLS